MAQKVNILLVDDVDGSEAAETVTFGLDGYSYEIDLNKKNAEKVREALAPYIAVARKVGRKTGTAGPRTQVGPAAAEIRAWAEGQGIELPARGRIPADVRAKYDAAH